MMASGEASGRFRSKQLKDRHVFVSPWPPVFLCAGLIFYVSTAAPLALVAFFFSIPHGDKVGHGLAYAILTFLCAAAFRLSAGQWAARYAVPLTLGAVFGFGALCEWCQFYVPFRTVDRWDIFANTVGSCLAVVLGTGSRNGGSKPQGQRCGFGTTAIRL
jgi:hypothetical protein